MNNNKKTPNLIIPPELEGKTFLDPKYDTAFKLLFQEKELLIHFLNGVLHLNEQDKIKDIDYRAQENILGFTDAVTTVRFDLMAKTEKDEFIHIEIQKARHTFWKDRVLLYNAALMLQAKKDFHFHKSIYKLPKIISVWVCDFKQGEGSHFHEEWSLYRRSDLVKGGNAVPVTDLLSYIFLELPSFNKSLSELKSIEDKWLYLLNTAGDSVHSPVTDDVRIARAYAKLRVDRQSQEILLEQVESMITEAEKNEHRLEARAEGLAEGEIKKAREMAKSMLAKEFNISVIAEISGLSEEEILKL